MDKTKTKHYKIDDIAIEEYYYKNNFNDIMCFVIKENEGCTEMSIRLLTKVKSRYRKFIKAVVDYLDKSDIFSLCLMLEDEDGNQLYLSGCNAGYSGEGPTGTFQILNSLGFNVDKSYVYTANTFQIYHPDTFAYKSLFEED